MSGRHRSRPWTGMFLGAWAALAGGPAQAGEALVAVGPGEVLRVLDGGQGPPVLLLPSSLGTAYGYRRLMGPLAAAGHRVLAVEPLGFGGSSRPPDADYSLTAQADRLAALLDRLGLVQAVVVGDGQGGSVALRLAARHPERVTAVVALDAGLAESATSAGLRRVLKLAPLVRLLGGSRFIRGQVRGRLLEGAADPAWVTDEVVEGYLGPAARDFDGAITQLRRVAQAREPESVHDRLPDVRCPVVLLVGTLPHRDGVQPGEVETMAARLPRFERRSVPGVGRFLAEEAPTSIIQAVERILAAHRSPPPSSPEEAAHVASR